MKRRSIIQVAVILGIMVVAFIAGAALNGPAIGNIFSNTVMGLNSGYTESRASGAFAPPAPPTTSEFNDVIVAMNEQDYLNRLQTDVDGEPVQRVILKNASLTITVANPAETITSITRMAESMGGWVVSSNAYTSKNANGETVTSGTVVVRVPAERLNEALGVIKSGAGEVNAESINGQDVTQEYVDLSSRLKNLQASEEQLQTIMQTAKRVDDVLAVQTQLTNVRSEIEMIEGRLKYFDEAAAYSSITVTVSPVPPNPIETQSAGWSPGKTAESAFGVLVAVVRFVADAVITLAIIGIPLLIVVGIPVLFIQRRRQTRVSAIMNP